MANEIHARAAVQRNALVIIAAVVSGAAFYWLGAILTPLALALFLMVMIDSFARVLAKVPRFPPMAALPVAIVLAIVGFLLIAFMMADNAAAFAGQLLGDGPKFNARIASLAGAMHLAMPPTVEQMIERINPSSYFGRVVQGLEGFASNALFVMIYLGFMLASRHGFERKTQGLFHSEEARRDAVIAFQRIRNGVERYLWVQAVACGIIAFASWAVISLVGLEDALFWAFLIFLVCYVPVIGGAIAILLPPLFAFVQFDDWWHAAIILVGLQMIHLVVGSIVYPRMQGKSLNIDPLVILLSLTFWGAIWGLPGLFLSTPLTVAAMVILAQFPGSRWIAVLLSSDGHPLGEEATNRGVPAAIADPIAST
jgi:AI-2 transport protein TqsA